ncbi:hypothetical protein TNCV_4104051 [Trichonephila clavipes]|nr:hypothetical protein TNCV_4104051 [Trichonephila clavipes]
MGRTNLLERRQSESVGRRNRRSTFLRSDWPRPFARREVGVEMDWRRAIGRSTPQARKRRALRASESDEQRALRLENLRVHATETRSSESSDQREVRLETDRIRTNQICSSETTELRERRLQNVLISTARSRRTLHADLNLSAFHYDSNND